MHGTVSEFKPGKESWSTYTERLRHYFLANGVTEESKKRSILLAVCGSATFQLIQNLTEAGAMDTMPYNDLVALVKDYYEPPPSPIVQRYKFNTRDRAPGETIAAYIAALRELSVHCKYGTALSEMLRDRLVCGVNHDTIQKRLLSEKDLTFDTAMKLAQSIEATERDTRKLKNSNNSSSSTGHNIHFNRSKRGQSFPSGSKLSSVAGRISCYRCGGNHLAPACKFKDAECRFCKKKGHLARVCRAKEKSQNGTRGQSSKKLNTCPNPVRRSPRMHTPYSLSGMRQVNQFV